MATYQNILIFLILFVSLSKTSPLDDSCTVSSYDDVATAASNCDTLTIKDIEIPEKTTLNIDLKDGAKLIFDGHLTHVPALWTGDLVHITGKNVDVSGTSNHLLDGLGPKHWKGGDEPTIQRPKFIRIKLQDSQVTNLHLKNCPNNCIMLSGSSNLVVANILIDNKDGYPGVAGTNYAKNTDGFDVSSTTNLRVKDSIVFNQDDCVAVNGGYDMVFDNLQCNGSHGFSFSVRNGDVHDIEFRNSHIGYSNNAIHIKTHNDGTTGTIRNVIYRNITFNDIDRTAISIQENYPSGEALANIPITNLTLDNVQGTMTGSKSIGINIICAENGCSDWHWTNVKVTGAENKNVCDYVPSGVSC